MKPDNYVEPRFMDTEQFVQYIMNNYNFPLTVNTDYEEEVIEIFKAYKNHCLMRLNNVVSVDHNYYLDEYKRISSAPLTSNLKAKLVEALKLHDLDRLL